EGAGDPARRPKRQPHQKSRRPPGRRPQRKPLQRRRSLHGKPQRKLLPRRRRQRNARRTSDKHYAYREGLAVCGNPFFIVSAANRKWREYTFSIKSSFIFVVDMNNKAYLLLQDGLLVEGTSIGHVGTTGGEICFNTGMTGYQEIYTDPSYYGQIIVNTTAHIGNYGTTEDEQESLNPKIAGHVVNDFSREFSRPSARESLQQYLEKFRIVGIADVDTRMLVRYIRSKGAMNALISSVLSPEEMAAELARVPS